MNILSIDIDYAFSPTICDYDDYIEGSRISLAEQSKINRKLNLPRPKANQNTIEYLRQVIQDKTTSLTPIIIAEHHHKIMEYLPSFPFTITNFDHHHDILYPGWHDLNKIDEGNWVSFLNTTPITKFTWVRNKGSENIELSSHLKFPFEETYKPEVEVLPHFDLVFGCSSCHWTGLHGRHYLFQVLEASCAISKI